jgi:hypothetical protein
VSLTKEIRRVMKLPMTRAALSALPGFEVTREDDRFADALARLEKAETSNRSGTSARAMWD